MTSSATYGPRGDDPDEGAYREGEDRHVPAASAATVATSAAH